MLRADRLVETIELLSRRIVERFPASGLNSVASELLALARTAQRKAPTIGKPIYALRLPVGLLMAVVLTGGILFFRSVIVRADQVASAELPELLEILEAGTNLVIIFGLVLFFLFSIETRIKRARALREIHQLRSIAHVIDMHQLVMDPVYHRGGVIATQHSPKRELSLPLMMRFFDYCSESLSLTSKIAALYIREFNDAVVLDAVSDVEVLCDGLSRKIAQKMTMAEGLRKSVP
jgi:hypothetical protein